MLRSNALSTGQNVVRGLAGTVVGFVVGGLIVYAVGTDTTVLWVLLPFAVLFAGLAPAAFSFAAGQAGFTVTVVILFNIIEPTGWKVGLVRVEDVALGCAVSLVVGAAVLAARGRRRRSATRWPTPTRPAPDTCAARSSSAASAATARLAPVPRPEAEGQLRRRPRPAASTTRSASSWPNAAPSTCSSADVTTLITGVAGLRLAADAVLDLWEREDGTARRAIAAPPARNSTRPASGSPTGTTSSAGALAGDGAGARSARARSRPRTGGCIEPTRRDLAGDRGRRAPRPRSG